MGGGGDGTPVPAVTLPEEYETRAHGFKWSVADEPHQRRRKAILAAHPEIKHLFGVDLNLKWQVCAYASAQVALAVAMRDAEWPLFLLVAWLVGGALTANLVLAMHELAHNLAFKTPLYNRILSICVANAPIGIPAAISFRRYHLEHHKYQGEDTVDADVPTDWEASFFTTPARKVLWLILQPAFYALRPMIVAPKTPGAFELLNVAYQVTFDLVMARLFGIRCLVFMLASVLLGMGLHPCAYHFVSEHYVFTPGYETYSYYGRLNWITYNVGYHNEHHDFSYIPGSRLPMLRKIAPEFYDHLPHYDHFVDVFVKYIFDQKQGPHSRVKRETMDADAKARILAQGDPSTGSTFGIGIAVAVFAVIGVAAAPPGAVELVTQAVAKAF